MLDKRLGRYPSYNVQRFWPWPSNCRTGLSWSSKPSSHTVLTLGWTFLTSPTPLMKISNKYYIDHQRLCVFHSSCFDGAHSKHRRKVWFLGSSNMLESQAYLTVYSFELGSGGKVSKEFLQMPTRLSAMSLSVFSRLVRKLRQNFEIFMFQRSSLRNKKIIPGISSTVPIKVECI